MRDLDEQLRRYVDGVAPEIRMDELRGSAHRSRRLLPALAGAAVVVAAIVVVFVPHLHQSPPVTTLPTTQPTVSTTTSKPDATTSTTQPEVTAGGMFPDQIALPMVVFIDGVIYDLSEVPAPAVMDIGQSAAPYAGPPVATSEGLIVATGDGYDATLTLYPSAGGDPLVLAQGVGSFVLSPDGSKIAWCEPFKGAQGNATETSLLVEAEFPSGEVLDSMLFLGFPGEGDPSKTFGFAEVAAFVGNNVLLMTGDGASASAAVWRPDVGAVIRAVGYNTNVTGNVSGNRVVLGQGDGLSGVVVTVADDGTVDPPDGGMATTGIIDYSLSRSATFSPDGSLIVSGGIDSDSGEPTVLLSNRDGTELVRIPVTGVTYEYFEPEAVSWTGDGSLLMLGKEWGGRISDGQQGEQWGIYSCDTVTLTCGLIQPMEFSPTDFDQIGLVEFVGPATTATAFPVVPIPDPVTPNEWIGVADDGLAVRVVADNSVAAELTIDPGDADVTRAVDLVEKDGDLVLLSVCCEPAEGQMSSWNPKTDAYVDFLFFGLVRDVDAVGRMLLVLTNGRALVALAQDGTELARWPVSPEGALSLIDAAWSPDGATIAFTASSDTDTVRLLAFSSDGSAKDAIVLAEGSWEQPHPEFPVVDRDGHVWYVAGDGSEATSHGYVVNPATGEVLDEITFDGRVVDMSIDSSGAFLIITYADGSVQWRSISGDSGVLATSGYINADW